MSLAEKLEQLARLVPGIGGYQDKEKSRDTDRALRMRLVSELEEQRREVEETKRLFVERRDLSPLTKLDRLTSKLDKLASDVRYAPRGYRGVFDPNKHVQKSLDDVYDFDLSLFAEAAKLRAFTAEVRNAHADPARLETAMELFSQALDDFEKIFHTRETLLA
jgi:hypothetical protein